MDRKRAETNERKKEEAEAGTETQRSSLSERLGGWEIQEVELEGGREIDRETSKRENRWREFETAHTPHTHKYTHTLAPFNLLPPSLYEYISALYTPHAYTYAL
jgi:hypothetical protein